MKQKHTLSKTDFRLVPGIGISVWQEDHEATGNLPAMRITFIMFLCFLWVINDFDIFVTPKTGKIKSNGSKAH